LVEIRGKIARKLNFWDQLRAKLKKFATKNYFAKGVKLWEPNQLKLEVKLKKFKSLMVN
jgi:hypothetical protein